MNCLSLRATFTAGLLASAATIAACGSPVFVEVPIDTGQFVISSTGVSIPAPLRDPAAMTLLSIPCASDATCPQIPGVTAAVRCANNACDPDPISFDLSTTLDISSQQEIRRFGSVLRLTISRAQYTAVSTGLQTAVGPTELRWGPDGATSFDAADVQPFGTVPVVALSGGETTRGEIALDPGGSAALATYLARTAPRVTIFARPSIDLAPGGPLPSGEVTLQMRLTVRVEGQLVR